MRARKLGGKRSVAWLGILFLVCVAAGVVFLLWSVHQVHGVPTDEARIADVAALAKGGYDGVLLSMYTPEAFPGEDFNHYRGVPTLQAFHAFKNLADIGDYLEQCFNCNPDLSSVYIGFDAYAVSSLYGNHASLYIKDYENYLLKYAQTHSDTQFELLLPSYSLAFLQGMPEDEYEEIITSYRNLVNLCIPYDNISVYLLGYEEWLIANPGNYSNAKHCIPDVVHAVLVRTFRDDYYVLEPDNMEGRFEQLKKLVQAPTIDYPDLSQWCMVFLGDSILQYITGSYSIPGVVGGLTGAQVYNCAQGGIPASESPGAVFSARLMVERFLAQDISGLDEDDNFVHGLTGYGEENHDGKKYCFIIKYGTNDYYGGHPVENPEDGYDLETYAGALRTSIRTLKEAYPDAEILLLTPLYTTYFSEGEKINSEGGGVLTDYVDATLRIAEDMDVVCINVYADSGIDKDTQAQYLADGCHPNEKGAYLLGNRIIEEMAAVIAAK